MAKIYTGLDANGAVILFEAETDVTLTDVKFLVDYERTAPNGAAPTSWIGNAAPNFLPTTTAVTYSAGTVARVGLNEAAALVEAGIAEHY